MGRWKEERCGLRTTIEILGRREECKLKTMRKKEVKESEGTFWVLHNLTKD